MTFFAMIRDSESRLLQRVAVNRSEIQVLLARRCRKQGYKSNIERGLLPFRKLSFAGRLFGEFVRLICYREQMLLNC